MHGFYENRRTKNGYTIVYRGNWCRSECRPCGLKWEGDGEDNHVKQCPLCGEKLYVEYQTRQKARP